MKDICIYSYGRKSLKTEDRYPCLFDYTGTAMFIVGEDTTILLMSKECEGLTGYARDDVERKKSWREFTATEELERLEEYHRLMQTEPDRAPKTFETRMIDKQGNVKDIFVTAAIIPGTKMIIASLIDITERKNTEKLLRQSENKFRALIEQLPNTIIYMAALDEKSTTLYVSPQIKQILGYSQGEYTQYPDIWSQCIHPDDKDRVLSEVARCHKTGEPFISDYRMIRRDGQEIWFHDTAHVIKDDRGNPLFLLGINADISERKAAELKLNEWQMDLLDKTHKLEELNIALKILLEKRENDRKELEAGTILNVKQLIGPYIEKLKNSGIDKQQMALLEILESNLKEICSKFTCTFSSPHLNLTPTEIQIANLIKLGKTTKEISNLLSSSEKAVAFHRGNIRKKLGLENRKINLQSYLSAKAL